MSEHDNDYQNPDAPKPEVKKVFEPLDDEQIAYAHELLKELHPLDDIPIRESFQWLGAVTCHKKKSEAATDDDFLLETYDGRQTLTKPKTVIINGKEYVKKSKKKKKNPLNEKAFVARPVAQLGFGIVAYLDMLFCLIWSFVIYSAFLFPTFVFFSHGAAYDSVPEVLRSNFLDSYIGNLGYSSVQCASIPQPVGQLVISCPYGTIGEIYDYGVNVGLTFKY